MPNHKLTASFEVTTPLIMSGFSQNRCDLRLASFKGILRYWWRALAWGKTTSITDLRRHEEAIFGSVNTGQQLVTRLRLGLSLPTPQRISSIDKGFEHLTLSALVCRSAIPAPFKFTIEFLSKTQDTLTGGIVPLSDAIKAAGLLGGMGYRSRKGLGSLTLKRLEGNENWQSPQQVNEYKTELTELLKKYAIGEKIPPFSAMNAHSQVYILGSAQKATKLLSALSSELVKFKKDLPKTGGLPLKTEFGLPIGDLAPKGHSRRGSPIHFHVHSLSNVSHTLVATLLPGTFLPDRKVVKGKEVFTIPDGFEKYETIKRFLNGPAFPSAEIINGN